jgi:hypothetical protein
MGCGVIAARTIVVPHFGHGAVLTTAFDTSVLVSTSFIFPPRMTSAEQRSPLFDFKAQWPILMVA